MTAGTSRRSFHATQAKDAIRLVPAMNAREPVVTVGVRGLTWSVTVPGAAATASRRRVTLGSPRNSQRRKRARSGCGSIATTRAPSRDQERVRLPTWAPMSKHKAPGRTNSR